MEATPNAAAVTPEGVRDGDPAALHGLVARRGPAVVAFCAEIVGPAEAPRAAAEAFARFRAAVRAAADPAALNPETLLRGAARHACAALVPTPPPAGRLRRRDTPCAHVPTLLAARAGGALGAADEERLARHLQRCERCRALAESFRRAEVAYAEAPDEPLPQRTAALLVAGLEAAVPATEEPPPAVRPPLAAEEPAPAAEQLPLAAEQPPLAADEPATADEPPLTEEPPAVEQPAAAAEPPPTQPLDVADIGAASVDAPVVDHPDDARLGDTVDWEPLPDVPHEHHGPLDGELLGGGRERRTGAGRGVRIAVPVVIVAGGIVAALAIAGVFGGDDNAPSKQQTVPPISTSTARAR